MKTRRQFLAATAPIAVTVAIPAPVMATPFHNPDTAILTAFETYAAAYRRIDDIRDDKDPEKEAAYQAMYAAQDVIADAMPKGALGLAAFLKVAFQNIAQSMAVDDAIMYDKPLVEGDHFGCVGEQMLWKLIQRLEAQAGARA